MEKGDNLGEIIVLQPDEISERLREMLGFALENYEYEIIRRSEDISCLRNKRILFAIEIGNSALQNVGKNKFVRSNFRKFDWKHFNKR
jgi:hypothetical protein